MTIPKPLRDYLGLAPGDRIKFQLQRDGESVAAKIVKAGRSSAEIKLRERGARGRSIRKGVERRHAQRPIPPRSDGDPRKRPAEAPAPDAADAVCAPARHSLTL
ncbi:hypothetical protein [Desertibaculum subflavum]|uniref:hypothetical protein n=1 Tax=Desertibaculum subflavum TaxID=2268458 RepID=UPI000E66BD7A